jgi:hypothetical protein
MSASDRVLTRYGLAVLAALVSLLVQNLLNPLFGPQNIYHTAWAAVVFASWCADWKPF